MKFMWMSISVLRADRKIIMVILESQEIIIAPYAGKQFTGKFWRWNDVCDNYILRQMRQRDTIFEYCAEIFYREKGKREWMEYRKETFMP